jgi:SAM-dependent methyltransferase
MSGDIGGESVGPAQHGREQESVVVGEMPVERSAQLHSVSPIVLRAPVFRGGEAGRQPGVGCVWKPLSQLAAPGSLIACTASYLLQGVHMTDLNTTLAPALRKALELLADPPTNPDVSKGYLDLLGAQQVEDAAVPKNSSAIQAVFASRVGSMLYDNAQALSRRLLTVMQQPTEWLNIPPGGIALDVGCGPGSVTASLGRAAGPDGLALGVDISEPMLARGVRAEAGPQIGFLRADAQRLPLRDETVDAVVSIAVLQLVPDPAAALAELARVLRPGGRLAVMVPTVGRAARFWRMLPNAGAHMFGEDELGDILEGHGFASIRTKNFGPIQWVRGKRG